MTSIFLIFSVFFLPGQELQNNSEDSNKIVKVAVQAFSRNEPVRTKWSATIDYLSHSIEGYTFQLVPDLNFDEVRKVVRNKEADFVITNPSLYINLSFKCEASRIATLINGRGGDGYTEFGGVLFVLAERDDINLFTDVKGRSIMGFNKDSFGGWQIGYRELLDIGIDLYRDCREVLFSPAKTQEEIVYSVLQGKVDIGTVRTGILENMAINGEIDLDDFKIIQPVDDDFPFFHSTRLYPEWAFSALKDTDSLLTKKVAIALLQLNRDNPAAIDGGYTGWHIPLSYDKVLDLLKVIKAPPFDDLDSFSIIEILNKFWPAFLGSFIFILYLFVSQIYILRINRTLRNYQKTLESKVEDRTSELKLASKELQSAHSELELKVTERTEELKQANIRLLELDKLKSMFIASMSHELRTPLNSIIGFTGLILQGISGNMDENAKNDLEIVYISSKHLLNLINDVIDISKIEADKFEVYFENVKLNALIDEVISIVSKDANKKNITIKVMSPTELIVYTDRKRLFQCLLNLASNAVKYTEKGSVELKIEMNRDHLKIIVTDSGIGMKKEDLPKLFNSFVRLESHIRDVTLGTGLGLYLTKKIITGVFQGDISVESEYGKGSTFILKIPIIQND